MFFTEVNIPNSSEKINYSDKIMTLGSCFAENIGKKMSDSFFRTDINPFGVLYNPVSVLQSLDLLMSEKQVEEKDLFQHQSLWHSFNHSSLFSDESVELTLVKINNRLNSSRQFFKSTQILLITFGTAWVFEDVESGKIVANCHKLPGNRFRRYRLDFQQIIDEYNPMLRLLKEQIPSLQLIFTVSPIRHWKDGAHENTVSKSTLHLSVDALEKRFDFVHYFPAYEIMMDELRDYRFYDSDMLHPSAVAVNYIWQRFSDTYFSAETQKLNKELEQIRNDLNHRPLHSKSAEYQLFIQNIEKRKAKIKALYPDFGNIFDEVR